MTRFSLPDLGTLTLKPTEPATTTSTTTMPETHQVLRIPEIIGIIFLYLSESNRKRIASRVCQQWHSVVQNLVLVPPALALVMNASTEERTKVLRSMVTAPRNNGKLAVSLQLDHIPANRTTKRYDRHMSQSDAVPLQKALQETEESIKDLRAAWRDSHPTEIVYKKVDNNDVDSQEIVAWLPHLHELSMESPFVQESLYFFAPHIGCSLRTLRLQAAAWLDPFFAIQRLLDLCPYLDELFILNSPEQTMLTPPNVVFPGAPPNFEPANPKVLRTLVVQQLLFIPEVMEYILGSLPRLRTLLLSDGYLTRGSDHRVRALDIKNLLSILEKSCPDLEALQISIQDQNMQPLTSLLVGPGLYPQWRSFHHLDSYYFPKLKSLSFSIYELSIPTIIIGQATSLVDAMMVTQSEDSLLLVPGDMAVEYHFRARPFWVFQHLTRLELLSHNLNRRRILVQGTRGLQIFLCNAPNLEHLIAPDVTLYFPELDIYSRVDVVTGEYQADVIANAGPHAKDMDWLYTTVYNEQKYPWVCQKLKTLYIALDGASMDDSASAPISLLIFGYISRACPLLTDLQITRASCNLSYEGGLCLLGRLTKLERLVLITSSWNCIKVRQEVYLDGVRRKVTKTESETTLVNTLTRKGVEFMRRFPEDYKGSVASASVASFSPFSKTMTKIALGKKENDTAVHPDFTKVGSREDISAWEQERVVEIQQGTPLWPFLEKFEIRYEYEGHVSDAVEVQSFLREVRPEVEVDVRFSQFASQLRGW